jgi:mono/diheme cytochrome c family protein
MSRPAIIGIIMLALAGGLFGAWLSMPAATSTSGNQAGTWDPADPALGSKAYVMCQGCHGLDGRGVPGYAPPLAASVWLNGPPLAAILIVLNGFDATSEPGAAYVSARMLGHARQLTDHEAAALLSWARSQWGNNAAPITGAEVAAVRARFANRGTAWSPAELRSLIR